MTYTPGDIFIIPTNQGEIIIPRYKLVANCLKDFYTFVGNPENSEEIYG